MCVYVVYVQPTSSFDCIVALFISSMILILFLLNHTHSQLHTHRPSEHLALRSDTSGAGSQPDTVLTPALSNTQHLGFNMCTIIQYLYICCDSFSLTWSKAWREHFALLIVVLVLLILKYISYERLYDFDFHRTHFQVRSLLLKYSLSPPSM